ncbi:MAG: calcium/sodium antiporter [Clostridia bacterium]|nr:calcium/sodium antiporter [Clostridia bacterium]
MLVSILLFAVGLVLLIKGGDWFVDGATGLAKRFKLPDIVVGATVVSIGTTLPEVMVSTTGALQGSGAMAYGNAIGSIICNTALIAAISIFVNPGPVNVKSMKTPVIFFFSSAALYCLAAYGLGTFPRWMGLVMLTIFVVYTVLTVRNGMKNPDADAEEEEEDSKPKQLWQELVLLVVGAAVIAIGADLLVEHGQIIALGLGVPATVVALLFVALGTSLPELVTTITSLRKGRASLGIGNVIGANVFNLVLVSGVAVTLAPFDVPVENTLLNTGLNLSLVFDIPVMLLVMSLMCFPAMAKKKLGRWQGITLLCIYAAFCVLQFVL